MRHKKKQDYTRFKMQEDLVSIGNDFWIEDENGERIFKVDGKAMRARETLVIEDRQGNTLNTDGSVTRPQGMSEALEKLAQAQVTGFTLPYRFGGLNFPNVIYSIAIEMISRADASLMNVFGLQGIAETIYAFADDELIVVTCS